MHLLVKMRNGLPPIYTERDITAIPGFWQQITRPWTPRFSQDHLGYHRDYVYKGGLGERVNEEKLQDPYWKSVNVGDPGGSLSNIPSSSSCTSSTPSTHSDGQSARCTQVSIQQEQLHMIETTLKRERSPSEELYLENDHKKLRTC